MSDTPPDLAALGNEPETDAATFRDLRAEFHAAFGVADVQFQRARQTSLIWVNAQLADVSHAAAHGS